MKTRMRSLAVLLTLAIAAPFGLGQDSGRKSGMHDMQMGMMKPDKNMVTTMTSSWPEASRKAAMMAMEKYGPPQEATESMLAWTSNGPWLKTVIYKEEVKHDFPMAHTDVMEQWVAYKVPWDKFDELAAFDGSVIAERTKGVLSARCDKEGANFLALNLANDVVRGDKSVDEARKYYAKAIDMMMKENKMDPYMQKLNFDRMSMSSTADPDKMAMKDTKSMR